MPGFVQMGRQGTPVCTCGFHASENLFRSTIAQPRVELLKTFFRVWEALLRRVLLVHEYGVKVGFRDVDTQRIHVTPFARIGQFPWTRTPRRSSLYIRALAAHDTVRSSSAGTGRLS